MKTLLHRFFTWLAGLFATAEAEVQAVEPVVEAEAVKVEQTITGSTRTIADVQADLKIQQDAYNAAVADLATAQAAKDAAKASIATLIAEGRTLAAAVETDFKGVETSVA